MSVGPWQIAIIALVVLLLFGATRLGDIGKGLGEGIKNFKKGITEDDPDDESPAEEDTKQLKAEAKADADAKAGDAEASDSAKKDA